MSLCGTVLRRLSGLGLLVRGALRPERQRLSLGGGLRYVMTVECEARVVSSMKSLPDVEAAVKEAGDELGGGIEAGVVIEIATGR